MSVGQARSAFEGWFTYPLLSTPNATTAATALTLAGTVGAQTEGTIPIYQSADFYLDQVQFFDTQSTNNGQFSVQFGWGGTQTVWFTNGWVLVPTIFGQGNLTHPFKEPIFFPRGSFIQVSLRNETANARTLYFAFEGRNVNVTDNTRA